MLAEAYCDRVYAAASGQPPEPEVVDGEGTAQDIYLVLLQVGPTFSVNVIFPVNAWNMFIICLLWIMKHSIVYVDNQHSIGQAPEPAVVDWQGTNEVQHSVCGWTATAWFIAIRMNVC